MSSVASLSSAYSGSQADGYNPTASYNRSYFTGTADSVGDIRDLWTENMRRFGESGNSRLVMNLTVPNHVLHLMQEQAGDAPEQHLESVMRYPDNTNMEGRANLIFAANSQERSLSPETIGAIQSRVENTLKSESRGPRETLGVVGELVEQGYVFSLDPSEDDLMTLWGDTFGWSRETIHAELQNSDDTIMVLRDPFGRTISGAMISKSGESTEWSTNPSFQGRGLIRPLLLCLHAYAIHQMMRTNSVTPITCEARFDRSVKPGILTGMQIDRFRDEIRVLTNHVTIGDSQPDSWNAELGVKNGMDFSQLRSFVSMSLRPEMYDRDMVESILQTARI